MTKKPTGSKHSKLLFLVFQIIFSKINVAKSEILSLVIHGLSKMWCYYKYLLNMLEYMLRSHALDLIIQINIPQTVKCKP